VHIKERDLVIEQNIRRQKAEHALADAQAKGAMKMTASHSGAGAPQVSPSVGQRFSQEAQRNLETQYAQSYADKLNAPLKRQPKGALAHRERDRSSSPARDNLMEGQQEDRSHHSSPASN
jgi:hypothetical protein